jgi:hypothetical protein
VQHNTRRPQRLGTLRKFLTLMVALDVLAIIDAALIRLTRSTVAAFDVPVDLVYGPQPYVLQQLNRQLHPWTVNVSVEDPSVLQLVLGLLTHGLAFAVATLPMLIFARRLVDRAVDTHPFTPEIATGLRRLGIVILAGGLAAELVRSAAAIALYNSALTGSHPFADTDWMIGFWWLAPGLVVLAFAQVIEYGCRIRTELDEVI